MRGQSAHMGIAKTLLLAASRYHPPGIVDTFGQTVRGIRDETFPHGEDAANGRRQLLDLKSPGRIVATK